MPCCHCPLDCTLLIPTQRCQNGCKCTLLRSAECNFLLFLSFMHLIFVIKNRVLHVPLWQLLSSLCKFKMYSIYSVIMKQSVVINQHPLKTSWFCGLYIQVCWLVTLWLFLEIWQYIVHDCMVGTSLFILIAPPRYWIHYTQIMRYNHAIL